MSVREASRYPTAMRLVLADADRREAFLEVAREWRAAGTDRYRAALEDFAAWLAKVRREAHQATCPPRFVAQDHYWLVDDEGRILGGVRLRHRLAPHLLVEGGHVGYDVRPSERRKGIGTRLLALTLAQARAQGLDRVLVTCDQDNVGSAKIIERNGGVETTTTVSERSGKVVRRYWIDLVGRADVAVP